MQEFIPRLIKDDYGLLPGMFYNFGTYANIFIEKAFYSVNDIYTFDFVFNSHFF